MPAAANLYYEYFPGNFPTFFRTNVIQNIFRWLLLKGALSSLIKFLANESRLKVMENAFYFILKALFVLKIFEFLSLHFGRVAKRLD